MRSRALLFALALLVVTGAPAHAAGPSPGAAGLGDRLAPGLGNGGYDVLHYDLDLRYATSAPSQPLDGTVTIVARATQALSRFNLDFAGQSVGGVSVDGRPATWRREGEELVITPRRALRKRERFLVRVTHFTAVPTVPDGDDPSSTAFFIHEHGSATAGQPFYEHFVYPSNDHPRDKASFTFRFDVPAGTTAVANGVPLGRWTRRGRTTWLYAQRQPMATELTQLAVGDLEFSSPDRRPGVLLRDVLPPALKEQMLPRLAVGPAQFDWMVERVGRYPFDSYGSLIVRADLGFALETQTLSVLDTGWFDGQPQGLGDATMVHELAHQWFGNSVAPYEWSDLWLNEGHASWYEFVYGEEQGFLADDTVGWPDENGYDTLEELMRASYAHSDQWRHDYGPVARPSSPDSDTLFSFNAYHGGALVLYALRQVVGVETFDRIERAWVARYRDGVASTEDFIALASRVARRDLSGFLRAWLYDVKTPPMPGHPDWVADPVQELSPAARALGTARHRRR
ncbi:MAG TPA: M1 family metallopeptidase [Solirubrobacteraceae bacterium]|nr:M1 family metallopeptidase [Solirubrobacteraceae bacterium]